MAIDSVDKRRSVLLEGVLPLADGDIGTQDRPHAVWIYRGITIATAALITNALDNAVFVKFRDKRVKA